MIAATAVPAQGAAVNVVVNAVVNVVVGIVVRAIFWEIRVKK